MRPIKWKGITSGLTICCQKISQTNLQSHSCIMKLKIIIFWLFFKMRSKDDFPLDSSWFICLWPTQVTVIYLIRRKCAFKDVISNKHTDLLIIGPSCTLKWTNPVLFRISEPYLVSCEFFFSFDPIFLY